MSCPDCFTGAIQTHAHPTGTERVLHTIRTYIALSDSGRARSRDAASDGDGDGDAQATTIIVITDAFGFNVPNTKLLADQYAEKTGFRVLVPDIIPGGGVPAETLQVMNSLTSPIGRWFDIPALLRRVGSILWLASVFIPFAIRSRGAFPKVLDYTRAVRAALPPDAKLGVAGFCWGGLQTTKLTAEPRGEGSSLPLVDAHFTAHPSGLKAPGDFVDCASRFHVPNSIAVGDEDMMMSKDDAAAVEAALRKVYVDGIEDKLQVVLYPGASHGFAVRADQSKTNEAEAAERAALQAIAWFNRFLV